MGKSFMTHLCPSLESTCKSRISNISTRYQNQGGQSITTFDAQLRNISSTFTSFMGLPVISNALQPFSKSPLTLGNAVNEHFQMTPSWWQKAFIDKFACPSLDSTCKSRISNISTRYQTCRGSITTFDAQLRNISFTLTSFMGFPVNIKCITAISNLHLQQKIDLMLNSEI